MHLSRRELIALSLAGGLAGPGRAQTPVPGVSPSDIRIGQTISLQAGQNAYGVAALQGMQLQFNAVNRQGGVHGRQLTLNTLDDQAQAATAEAHARQLLADGNFLLFGCIEGGPSTAVAKLANDAGVPLFGPMAGSPGLRRPHLPMVFPVRAEHRDEFRALMTWGQKTGLHSVTLVHADSATGREHLNNVQRVAQELGMRLVQGLPLAGSSAPPSPATGAQALLTHPADLVLNHGSADAYAQLILAAKQRGVRSTFMAVNSGSSQMAATLGEHAKGMVFAQVVPSPWERKLAIAREYQDTLKQAGLPERALSYGGLEGFMTAKALVLALRLAGPQLSREGFTHALESSPPIDLGGIRIGYKPGQHEGSRYVDLSLVNRAGRFIH